MSFKVLLLDNVDPLCSKILEERGIETTTGGKMDEDTLFKTVPDYDGIVVRSGTTVTPELLEAAKNLKVIGRAGVGVDNIDIEASTQQGVLVMNTPDGNTISTAEHTCGLILSMARNIPVAVQTVKEGGWDRKKYTGTEVHGKKLGIIGLGKIGAEVAQRMKGFGMDIVAYDPFATHEKAEKLGVELKEIDEVLGEADFITVHTPLTEKTKGLVSKENKDKLKKGVRLVNCARGGIYKEEDLLDLIEDGTVAGVALDVYTEEPPSDELRSLLQHPKVITTPHLGASTGEAQEKVAEQIATQMADALEKKSYKGSLNGKSIMLSTNKEVQPFLRLAEKLGTMVAQVAPEHSNDFSFQYTGRCAQYSDVMTDSILKGILSEHVDEAINLINARTFANDRGFNINETTSSKTKTFNDLITVKLGSDAEYKTISATIFGEDDFRVVDIDGFAIELRLEGDILIYKNIDKPGMLAAVSSRLSDQSVNIASLSLGRTEKGSLAVTAVGVDRSLTKEELDHIESMEGVNDMRYISFK